MTIAIPQYGGALQGDTAANPNTIPLRDNAGGLTVAQLIASELKSAAILTLLAPVAKTTTFTADGNAIGYECDASGGVFTGTLEPAATVPGRIHMFIRTSASNNVTVKGSGAELINGANIYVLTAQYKWVIVWSDGTGWVALGN